MAGRILDDLRLSGVGLEIQLDYSDGICAVLTEHFSRFGLYVFDTNLIGILGSIV